MAYSMQPLSQPFLSMSANTAQHFTRPTVYFSADQDQFIAARPVQKKNRLATAVLLFLMGLFPAAFQGCASQIETLMADPPKNTRHTTLVKNHEGSSRKLYVLWNESLGCFESVSRYYDKNNRLVITGAFHAVLPDQTVLPDGVIVDQKNKQLIFKASEEILDGPTGKRKHVALKNPH